MRAQRLRVSFSRGEAVRYITHLDLMRAWERALKRARLPLAYSEGFTRHPQIAMAAPLPVGATAEGELMDIFLDQPVPPTRFRDQLAVQTPPALSVQQVDDVPLAWPSLQSLVRAWRWRATFPEGQDRVVLAEQVTQFLAHATFPWELRRDREVKRYDLRRMVLDLTLVDAAGLPALEMHLRAEAGARPEQLAHALGYDPHTVLTHRMGVTLEPISHEAAIPSASRPDG